LTASAGGIPPKNLSRHHTGWETALVADTELIGVNALRSAMRVTGPAATSLIMLITIVPRSRGDTVEPSTYLRDVPSVSSRPGPKPTN
jgi:hypothetical protein